MNTKKIQLLLKDLDYRNIDHITVTPRFYDILEKKYGSEWVKSHCSINVPKPRFIGKKIYTTQAGRRILQKIRVDK